MKIKMKGCGSAFVGWLVVLCIGFIAFNILGDFLDLVSNLSQGAITSICSAIAIFSFGVVIFVTHTTSKKPVLQNSLLGKILTKKNQVVDTRNELMAKKEQIKTFIADKKIIIADIKKDLEEKDHHQADIEYINSVLESDKRIIGKLKNYNDILSLQVVDLNKTITGLDTKYKIVNHQGKMASLDEKFIEIDEQIRDVEWLMKFEYSSGSTFNSDLFDGMNDSSTSSIEAFKKKIRERRTLEEKSNSKSKCKNDNKKEKETGKEKQASSDNHSNLIKTPLILREWERRRGSNM